MPSKPQRPEPEPDRSRETLDERCQRLAELVAEYERDIMGRTVLDMGEIRRTLHDAAMALRPHNY